MDRIINTKKDKQTIYEIYRSCRLCGGGAGYKMPIVQSVIDLDNNGVELQQKIQECLQIEVHQDDKMPPLICELCVDKVNDFYDFMETCKQINKRTRMRLGLPLTFKRSVVSNASSDSGDCILGVTEPVFHEDDDNEPLSKSVKFKKESKSGKEENKKRGESKEDSKRSGKDKAKVKETEADVKIKQERVTESPSEARKTRNAQSKRDPTPPRGRSARASLGSHDDNVRLSTLKDHHQVQNLSKSSSTSSSAKSSPAAPRSIMKRELKELNLAQMEDESPRNKRARDKNPPPDKKPEMPPKKAKLAAPPTKTTPKPKSKQTPLPSPPPKSKRAPSPPPPTKSKRGPSPPPAPKSKRGPSPPPAPKSKRCPSPPPAPKSKRAPSPPPPSKSKRAPSPSTPPKSKRIPSPSPPPKAKRALTPPPMFPCDICGTQLKSAQGKANHMKSHVVNFTSPKMSCDPCGEWFFTADESQAHHRKHKTKPYRCRHCYATFKNLSDYDKHFEVDNCQPFIEVPDKKCDECWRTYATQHLLDTHRCQGADGRPGGKCNKCNRMYTLLKNLKKHEVTCTFKKKGEAIVDPEVEKRLKDTQIRLARCDDLLTRIKGECYDVSDVDHDFGFDSSCVYPYRYRVKSEPTTGYDTMVTIGDEIKEEYYARNYIHWDSDDGEEEITKKVDSLTTLTLKTIFSNRFLGKVPRKKRKVKEEKVFDNTDFDMSTDIDNIISNLDKNDSANDSDCSESIFGAFNNRNDNIERFDNLLGDSSQDTEKNFGLFDKSDGNKVKELSNNIGIELSKDVSNDNDSVMNDEEVDKSKVEDDKSTNDSSRKENIAQDDIGNDLSKDVSNDNDTVMNDKGIDKSKVNDNATNYSSLMKNSVQNNSDSSNNDTSQTNRRTDKLDNEQISVKDTECSNIENGVNNKCDDLSENNEKTENSSIKVNGQTNSKPDDLKDVSDSDMDDKKLMDALDAEIGDENNDSNERSFENNDLNQHSVGNNERIPTHDTDIDESDSKVDSTVNNYISDRLNKKSEEFGENISKLEVVSKEQNNLKEMDLDSISDEEFNFDT